jgi:transposase
LAHYFTEDEILAWLRSNPVGTGWMCEFGEVMRKPRRTISPVNHELALNWLREKYNLLTEKELSASIFKRILIWLTPSAIKKRRERLGLTTKRKPGSPAK